MGNYFSINCVFDEPISRFLHGKYTENVGKNLQSLQREAQYINAMKNDTLTRILKEEGRGQQVLPQVTKWCSQVERTVRDAKSLLDVSIFETQELSKDADLSHINSYRDMVCKTLNMLKILKFEGDFEVVTQRATQLYVEKVSTIKLSVSQQERVRRMWNYLADPSFGILGIYGKGGVGKTTLLIELIHMFLDDGDEYNLVIQVDGSKGVESIQEEIGKGLNLCFRQKTETDRASEINRFLKRRKYVLILDDIPKGVDLEEMGVPLPSRENGCKIAFTTRSLEACKWVDVKVQVECWSPEESWDLFRKKVGETTLQSHPDIPQLARIICKKCGGLPLALNLIGQAMSGKRMVREWHHAIHVLRTPTAESLSNHNILAILKFSYDSLPDENIRSCFLSCTQFPSDPFIRKDELVDSWIAKGIIGNKEDRKKVVIQGYEMVDTLVRTQLLMENECRDGVKMHDVVHEMSLWITSQASESGR